MENTRISRRTVLAWAAGLGVALPSAGLLAACGREEQPAGPGTLIKRVYQTAFGYNVGNCPEMVAREAGYFAELGIDCDVISSTGTSQAMSGLLSKATEYSRFQSISALITVANEDAPFVAFGTPVQR